MAETRLLHLDSSYMSAHVWRGGFVTPEGRFGHDATGHAAFAAYLQGHTRSLFYLLTDVPEESFHHESIPFVQGGDRKALIQRKLAQFFFGSTLTTALSLGREKGGRRDERMLFLALTRPQFFEPWLAALNASEVQLAGVFSVPLIAGELLQRIGLANRHERILLVTLGGGGIRQTYFENARLRFSRLSAVAGAGIEDVARTCASESLKLYQYLVSQRILARGTRLPTVVLVHPGQRAVFASVAAAGGELDIQFADLVHAASRSGMRGLPGDSSADALFLHLLARHSPREQFADAEARHLYRVWQVKFGLTATAGVALLGCLLFSAKGLYDIEAGRTARATLAARTEADTQRYNAILRDLPPMPASLENLRAVVARFEAMNERSDLPLTLYRHISQALEIAPEVDLRRIDWALTTDPDSVGGSRGGRAAGGPDAPMHAAAIIAARLSPGPARDPRAVLQAIERFAEALRADPAVKVVITRLPFDIESGKSLKSTDQSGGVVADTQFELRLSRRLGSNHVPA